MYRRILDASMWVAVIAGIGLFVLFGMWIGAASAAVP